MRGASSSATPAPGLLARRCSRRGARALFCGAVLRRALADEQADPVMAELWQPAPAVEQPRPPEPPPPPQVEPKPPPKPEPTPEPKVEPKPVPKPEIASSRKRRKRRSRRSRSPRKPKPKLEEGGEEEAGGARAKEEKERREKELAEKRRVQEENRKRMQDQLDREQAAAAPKASATAPPVPGDPAALDDAGRTRSKAKIRGNIILPPDLRAIREADLRRRRSCRPARCSVVQAAQIERQPRATTTRRAGDPEVLAAAAGPTSRRSSCATCA